MARVTEKVSVKFIQPNAPYMSGEIAGFPAAIAQRFVDRKRAVFCDADGKTIVVEPPAEEKPKAKPKAKAKK